MKGCLEEKRTCNSINNLTKFYTKKAECQKYSYFHLEDRFTMFSRLVALIFFVALSISCDSRLGSKTSHLKEMAADTLINYNSVDVYPLFMDCNNCDTSEKQNLCFEMEMARRLQKHLLENRLGSQLKHADTVFVDILVNVEGQISISEIHHPQSAQTELPNLDSLLYQSVRALPNVIQPALKRGIPVNSMYKLPIVLSPVP